MDTTTREMEFGSSSGPAFGQEADEPMSRGDQARATYEKAKEKASEVATKMADAASYVGHKAEDAATYVGQKADRATCAVGGALEETGHYLREDGLRNISEDVTNVIRRNPVPSLLVGVGFGFLLAQAMSRRG